MDSARRRGVTSLLLIRETGEDTVGVHVTYRRYGHPPQSHRPGKAAAQVEAGEHVFTPWV